MAFLAKLSIDDAEYMVLTFHMGLEQKLGINGAPVQEPVGGKLTFEVESSSSTDLFDWMVAPGKRKDGSITFFRRDVMGQMKRLDFFDAVCYKYDENFMSEGNNAMTTKVSISARKIQMEDIPVENEWAV
ncbi:type VI secretion system tube protein TssD [Plebeiibacterium marinum]|uniref:Type VI secretion system tube protein TssD n=1 Tax=Plebeiibacterium marinum TaxID=2992111 RepID=A0AAE3MHX5_9BACT|nr:type VI secretion system tube protein TssD [Plebeiobacterium marinum]MCW3807936.1 type VI secretion system tube protein TssD [Plebeiobacterium marinum]